MTFKIEAVVAQALYEIKAVNGYISTERATRRMPSTAEAVVESLTKNPVPVLDEVYWRLADEIVTFFRNDAMTEPWKDFKVEFSPCVASMVADEVEVPSSDFYNVVMAPHVFGKFYYMQTKEQQAARAKAAGSNITSPVIEQKGAEIRAKEHVCKCYICGKQVV